MPHDESLRSRPGTRRLMRARAGPPSIGTRQRQRRDPWSAREEILEQLRKRSDALPVVRAFGALGATRPVELDTNRKALLVEALARGSTATASASCRKASRNSASRLWTISTRLGTGAA